jgi:hypothetical protein
MKAVVAFLLGAASAKSTWRDTVKDWVSVDHAGAFKEWRAEFNKEYETMEEESYRFLQFLSNWEKINQHNQGNYTWTLALNQFGDLSEDEFRYQVHGHSDSCLTAKEPSPTFKWDGSLKMDAIILPGKLNANPTEIDWTNKDGKSYVTAVKNQGSCGSCWAFSTTGSLESRYAIAHDVTGKEIPTLSEQELVDCSSAEGNQGCNGGLMDDAFKYVEKEKGLCSEEEYPYTGKTGRVCESRKCSKRYVPISTYTDVKEDNEEDMETAVAAGPVSIAVDAAGLTWQFYNDGVVTKTCGTRLDHGVLAVGYGEEKGTKFWKVKNSWGASWGEDGYIRLCKECEANGRKGQCGILEQPSFPVVE